MHELDGLYRHSDATTTWDDSGVVIRRRDQESRVPWRNVAGVRQLGPEPGYVQLVVRGHVPPQRLSEDPWSIPVRSQPDADRLVTVLGWRAGAEHD